jgi:hypothetical protein
MSQETGYCPRCKTNVLLIRERIDTCLAIVLLIFTGGIGLIIYLAIYYSKPKDHCIHCQGKVTISPVSPSYTHQPQPQIQSTATTTPSKETEEVLGFRPNFCAYCGEKIRPGTNFCENCGSKVVI